MIPEEKLPAVTRALYQTFGVSEFEEIDQITRGLSSDLVFRIVVQGSPYLLRIATQINERMDPARIYACMQAASHAGLTPAVRYASVEDGVSLTDFIHAVPLAADEALHQIPYTLRTLHALPAFPKEFNYLTAHKFFIWRFPTAGLVPQPEIDQAFAAYQQICSTYPRLDADMVSSHLDLKPDNILFDGSRLWLVDWQAAFLNDRYFDLSVAAGYLLHRDHDEPAYLARYFGRPATDCERARFFLMRQALHLFSATVFLLIGAAGKPAHPPENLPSFESFQQGIWTREIDMADKQMQVLNGYVHWRRFLDNICQSRFADSLQTISAAHPPAGAAAGPVPRLFPLAP
ncbi:hypothetical protein DYQ86_23230 [Acidobacteria bacterium AB60]|nr:hypothetical protein DYQ86_23230 [Acidobacteria bacterium AB60]